MTEHRSIAVGDRLNNGFPDLPREIADAESFALGRRTQVPPSPIWPGRGQVPTAPDVRKKASK